MACIVCGEKVIWKKYANNKNDMFCGYVCHKEWDTMTHFVKVSWPLPTWSNSTKHYSGTSLSRLKTYFIK